MKKKLFGSIISLVIALTMLLLPTAVFADGEGSLFPLVYDDGYTLSANEIDQLTSMAQQVTDKYHCGVYVVVVEDMTDYGYYDVREFAQDIADDYELGYGDDRDMIMLMMSMAERDYDLDAYGRFGNYAFTDYGKEALADEFLDDFRNNDWYNGFYDYINGCSILLDAAAQGTPYDIYGSEPGYGAAGNYEPGNTDYEYMGPSVADKLVSSLPIGLFAGLVVGFLYTKSLKARMKTANAARAATRYIDHFDIHERHDRFSYQEQFVTHVDSGDHDRGNNGGGHIGGGTTVNSSGHSHSSGKF